MAQNCLQSRLNVPQVIDGIRQRLQRRIFSVQRKINGIHSAEIQAGMVFLKPTPPFWTSYPGPNRILVRGKPADRRCRSRFREYPGLGNIKFKNLGDAAR
jgi:hypothetical protein